MSTAPDGTAGLAGGDPACTPELLGTLFLFEGLTPEQRRWLCERGELVRTGPGRLCSEGEPAEYFWVLVDGELVTTRRIGDIDVETGRTSQPGVYTGATQAALATSEGSTYHSTASVPRSSLLFRTGAAVITTMMREWFPMATHMLEGMFAGMRASQQRVAERERLLALGQLSAGLTHELNNPAAAAVRATANVRERVAGMRHKLGFIGSGALTPGAITALVGFQEQAAERVSKAVPLGPLEAGDREDEVADWLTDRGIGRPWELAATFVAGGIDVEWLDGVADTAPDGSLGGAVGWLGYTVETELLLDEITESAQRISHLVGAAQQYSQLDRAPFRDVDLPELIDATLAVLGHKLSGVAVVRDYDRSLPAVPGYGAELNQVWTNLVDNAVAAMSGGGTLTVRTRRADGCAVVEVEDTGEGIPDAVRGRIFEPFFTTKPAGQGTGLGLDISWRIVTRKHGGSLTVESRPGRTVFRVELPLVRPAGDGEPAAVTPA